MKELPIEIVSKIVMMGRPKYPYLCELTCMSWYYKECNLNCYGELVFAEDPEQFAGYEWIIDFMDDVRCVTGRHIIDFHDVYSEYGFPYHWEEEEDN